MSFKDNDVNPSVLLDCYNHKISLKYLQLMIKKPLVNESYVLAMERVLFQSLFC